MASPPRRRASSAQELFWSWSLDTASHTYTSVHSLQLQGLGPVLPADAPGHGLQAGDRIRWSLSLTPVRTLLDLPLRLREELQITEGDIDAQAYADTIQVARCTEVLLGQVIQGVLDELSFHGGPQDQAEFRTELQSRLAAVQDECVETISADDLFADWDRPGYETLFETLGDVPPAQVRQAMRHIADEAPAGPALQQAFGGRVVVKPGFWNRPGRAFRKAFRAAGR